jgi:hypothetical protein
MWYFLGAMIGNSTHGILTLMHRIAVQDIVRVRRGKRSWWWLCRLTVVLSLWDSLALLNPRQRW